MKIINSSNLPNTQEEWENLINKEITLPEYIYFKPKIDCSDIRYCGTVKLVYTIYTENEDVEIWNIIIQDNENIYCFRAEKNYLSLTGYFKY